MLMQEMPTSSQLLSVKRCDKAEMLLTLGYQFIDSVPVHLRIVHIKIPDGKRSAGRGPNDPSRLKLVNESTRRLLIHESQFEAMKSKLTHAYQQIAFGNPLDEQYHMGPLIDQDAVKAYETARVKIAAEGGKVVVEGGVLTGTGYESGCYVKPCIYEMASHHQMVREETFAPILYLTKYKNLDEAFKFKIMCLKAYRPRS